MYTKQSVGKCCGSLPIYLSGMDFIVTQIVVIFVNRIYSVGKVSADLTALKS